VSHFTYRSIEEVLSAVSEGKDSLDLRGVRSMDPYALLLLDLLLAGEVGASLSVRWPESDGLRTWMQKMGFFDDIGVHLRASSRVTQDRKPLQPLTRIEDEVGIGHVVDAFEQRLREAYPVSESSRRTLVSIMIEMFQNIPHHSNATGEIADAHGIAAMQDDDDAIVLAIADRGIGIRRSLELRDGLSGLSDEEALYQVVVVGKSRHVDPGHGGELQKITKLARLWGGEFVVRSGASLYVAHETDETFHDVVPFPGVQMCLRLPRTLFEERPVEFEEGNAFNEGNESAEF
jgi:hypothetical protein